MEKRKLILSTGNKDKVKEIKDILKNLNIEILSKSDIGLGDFDIEEDGDTLEENSIKKAIELKKKTPFMVMADDSGLFVDVLNGGPGVYSSRYGGEEGNYKKNNEKLLYNMKEVPLEKRKASFFTTIALVTEEGEIITVEGQCNGHITFEPRGKREFGYDPLFVPEGYSKTFAELDEKEKNKISHRALALEKIRNTLINLLKED